MTLLVVPGIRSRCRSVHVVFMIKVKMVVYRGHRECIMMQRVPMYMVRDRLAPDVGHIINECC